jgi:hypothetical protein
MPKPRDHDQARDREHEQRREFDRKNIGDDPKRHDEILARRWFGSEPATFDRYANALRQWSKLPGAVVPPAPATKDEAEQ